MFRRTLILILTAAGAISAAPAPRHRPAPPPAPAAGEYVLTWAHIQTPVSLTKEGGYCASWGGREWRGTWCWDAPTRTLHIQESADGLSWSDWSVRLDEQLAGVAQFGQCRARVSLRAVKEARGPAEGVASAR